MKRKHPWVFHRTTPCSLISAPLRRHINFRKLPLECAATFAPVKSMHTAAVTSSKRCASFCGFLFLSFSFFFTPSVPKLQVTGDGCGKKKTTKLRNHITGRAPNRELICLPDIQVLSVRRGVGNYDDLSPPPLPRLR